MKKHLPIFLIFLIYFSLQQCSQREKLKNREFVKTLFVFIAPYNSWNDRYSEDDLERIKILYEQVMCAIPSYEKFKYMTVMNRHISDGFLLHKIEIIIELETDWNSARNKIKSTKSELSIVRNGISIFEETMRSILPYKSSYDRIEIFHYFPWDIWDLSSVYLEVLKEIQMNGHVNFIRHDSIEYFGYKSLNLPDISLIDLNSKEVSPDVKLLARNLVASILDIKPDPIKTVVPECDFFWKMFGLIVIGSVIGSIVGFSLATSIACFLKKRNLKSKPKSKETSPEKPTGKPGKTKKLAKRKAITEVKIETEGGTTQGSTQTSTQGGTTTSGTTRGKTTNETTQGGTTSGTTTSGATQTSTQGETTTNGTTQGSTRCETTTETTQRRIRKKSDFDSAENC
ncbi:unnamed protein product [Caenorhabditis angaria]|uniref:Domain of unknown function WSN domain-containing protein n=1 Tax=Caenorhabditis angaria TaxID=860376 RepID=A0A9P1IKD4_9PELO|nr:unnamed protein product [Caenorhabditis angaria]